MLIVISLMIFWLLWCMKYNDVIIKTLKCFNQYYFKNVYFYKFEKKIEKDLIYPSIYLYLKRSNISIYLYIYVKYNTFSCI